VSDGVAGSASVIRPVVHSDREAWMPLWHGYLDFYRESLDPEVTDHTFSRLCDRRDQMFGFVADSSGQLVGIVNALVHPSTWSMTGYCYLEDLFVARAARGTDVAKMLIDAVSREAKARGADHLYWHTQEFNGAARSLYDQVARLTSMRVYERFLKR
jgi:GNAT superfamily N-acetyltransferase